LIEKYRKRLLDQFRRVFSDLAGDGPPPPSDPETVTGTGAGYSNGSANGSGKSIRNGCTDGSTEYSETGSPVGDRVLSEFRKQYSEKYPMPMNPPPRTVQVHISRAVEYHRNMATGKGVQTTDEKTFAFLGKCWAKYLEDDDGKLSRERHPLGLFAARLERYAAEVIEEHNR